MTHWGGRLFFLLLTVAGLAFGTAAWADSWVPPHRTTYNSAHNTARLIVTPHFPIDGAPFTGRPRGPSAPEVAHGVLQRRDARGRWVVQWQGPLQNEVAPVGVLVADSGRYFVTFDDWGGRGFGPHVVVIYSDTGRIIRALSLIDLLPQDYIETLPRSFSSITWNQGSHRFSEDGERLLLSIAVPSVTMSDFPGGSFELAVTLATGAPGPRAGAEWDRAMATAVASRAAAQERQAAFVAFMAEPLGAPQPRDRERWVEYLEEAFKRLAPDWNMNNASMILIGNPTAPEGWRVTSNPREMLLSRNRPLAIMIASPDAQPLAAALRPIVSGQRRGWLQGIRLYLVAQDTDWEELERILDTSGATLVQIDPTEPIPQRPERLPRLTPPDCTQE